MTDKSVKKETTSFKGSILEFEKAFRELKSELYMKKNEVSKLKSELEEVRHENHTLKESLEKMKRSSEESKITMDMYMKKNKDFEPKYYEKRDAFAKLELHYKIEASKNSALRENLQKVVVEKSELNRKVEILEEKQKRDLMYSNDINQKLGKLKESFAAIKGDIQKTKEEQHRVTSLLQEVDLAEANVGKFQELTEMIKEMKKERDALEEQAVRYQAKSETLESFITANSRILEEDNLEARVLLTQCKKMSAHLQGKIKNKNEIIITLNESLCGEKETCLKLIVENEIKSKEIGALNNNIRELELKLSRYEPDQELGTVDESVVKKELDLGEIVIID